MVGFLHNANLEHLCSALCFIQGHQEGIFPWKWRCRLHRKIPDYYFQVNLHFRSEEHLMAPLPYLGTWKLHGCYVPVKERHIFLTLVFVKSYTICRLISRCAAALKENNWSQELRISDIEEGGISGISSGRYLRFSWPFLLNCTRQDTQSCDKESFQRTPWSAVKHWVQPYCFHRNYDANNSPIKCTRWKDHASVTISDVEMQMLF